jgi:hypothetical protein
MDRLVVVRAAALEDLCELAERAIMNLESVQPHDPLNVALNGAVHEVRVHATLEPVS